MFLKSLFNDWAKTAGMRYQQQQWLLSKWDVLDGVVWPPEKINILIDHVRHALDLNGNDILLDLGCGGGWILDRLGVLAARGFGCDLSIEMLRNASGRRPLFNADACALPLKDGCCDRVLCYFVLINFMDLNAVEQAISEIIRVLKPGGRAVIGQIPDKTQSSMYDQEKARYVDYCQKVFSVRGNNRDTCVIPIQLFEKEFFQNILGRSGCRFDVIPAFNPFYRPGEPQTIDWRFDVVIERRSG